MTMNKLPNDLSTGAYRDIETVSLELVRNIAQSDIHVGVMLSEEMVAAWNVALFGGVEAEH